MVNSVSICFIIPPAGFLIDPTMQAPLGVLYVAAYICKSGFETKILDLRSRSLNDYNFESINVPKADYYGFTASTNEIEWCKAFSNYIKKIRPLSKTIVGGTHATVLPEDCYQYFDYVVTEDGELVTSRILQGYEEEGIVRGIPVKDLDILPFPARWLLKDKGLSNRLFEGERVRKGESVVSTSMITTRGCPFNCRFCANWDRKVRYRSADNVVQEIKYLIEWGGCRHYRFVDDCFTLNKERLFELTEKMRELNIRFRCHTRSDIIDYDMLKALYEGGCREIAFGVETADEYILWKLGKRENLLQFREALKMAHHVGLKTKVYLMVGLPYETWETIALIKRFMKETQPDKWTLALFTPYPKCDIYMNPDKYGVRILTKDWNKYYQFTDKSVIETDHASNEELNAHYRELLKYLESGEWKK